MKHGHDNKKCEKRGIKFQNCNYFVEYANFKDLFFLCMKNYQRKFDTILRRTFFKTYKFLNHDISMFILFLPKRYLSIQIY